MLRVALLALLLFSAAANAETTGNQWMQQWDNNASRGRAISYLEGVLDAELRYKTFDEFMSAKNPKYEYPHFCVPSNQVTLGQIANVSRKYMDAHPEMTHSHASGLIIESLILAWPCPKNPYSLN